jgi:hypothetical protein
LAIGEAWFSVFADTKSLAILSLEVERDFQRKGVSEFMLAQMLKYHPDISSVEGDLNQTNFYIVRDAEFKGMPLKQAIKQSPAYKLRKRLGFTKILRVSEIGNRISLSMGLP